VNTVLTICGRDLTVSASGSIVSASLADVLGFVDRSWVVNCLAVAVKELRKLVKRGVGEVSISVNVDVGGDTVPHRVSLTEKYFGPVKRPEKLVWSLSVYRDLVTAVELDGVTIVTRFIPNRLVCIDAHAKVEVPEKYSVPHMSVTVSLDSAKYPCSYAENIIDASDEAFPAILGKAYETLLKALETLSRIAEPVHGIRADQRVMLSYESTVSATVDAGLRYPRDLSVALRNTVTALTEAFVDALTDVDASIGITELLIGLFASLRHIHVNGLGIAKLRSTSFEISAKKTVSDGATVRAASDLKTIVRIGTDIGNLVVMAGSSLEQSDDAYTLSAIVDASLGFVQLFRVATRADAQKTYVSRPATLAATNLLVSLPRLLGRERMSQVPLFGPRSRFDEAVSDAVANSLMRAATSLLTRYIHVE